MGEDQTADLRMDLELLRQRVAHLEERIHERHTEMCARLEKGADNFDSILRRMEEMSAHQIRSRFLGWMVWGASAVVIPALVALWVAARK